MFCEVYYMFQDILVLFGDFIVIFFISRLQINLSLTKAIKNRRHREKRKEKQSFFEWLFWTRFRDVISKWKLIHYLANIIVFVLFAIAMVLFHFIGLHDYCRYLLKIHMTTMAAPLFITYFVDGNYKKD